MILRALYNVAVLWPMLWFYEKGHWRGLERSAICASLQNYDASFWQAHQEACDEIISRQVDSNVVTVITGVYLLLLVYTCASVIRYSAKRLLSSAQRPTIVCLHETPGPILESSPHSPAHTNATTPTLLQLHHASCDTPQ